MPSVFALNLQARSALSQATREDLVAATGGQRFTIDRNAVVGHDTDARHLYVVESGMACRRQRVQNGGQQVTSLILPGEICDPFTLYLPVGRHPVHALTDVVVTRVPVEDVKFLMSKHRDLETALQWQARVASDIQHMWIGNLGRRPALNRMAHFFCEIAVRLDMVGLVRKDTFDFLLTQIDVADILGLSVIHTNRILQELKSMKLLELHSRTASISSFRGLQAIAKFDPGYLRIATI